MLPPGKTEVKLSGRFSEAEVTALADELATNTTVVKLVLNGKPRPAAAQGGECISEQASVDASDAFLQHCSAS